MSIEGDGRLGDPEIELAERELLGMLDAVPAALGRRNDVIDACFNVATRESAVGAIVEMLSIPERHAHAVLDLQF